MKFRLLAFVAFVCGVAACQTDNFVGGIFVEGEVACRFIVEAPELSATRADGEVEGKNSGWGAIDNADAAFWAENDIRYILEVYEDGNDETPIKKRKVKILPEYSSTDFEIRLVPNRNYRFVVFADFVAEGSSADDDQATIGKCHTIGQTLADITVKNDGINKEASDAYFISTKKFVSKSFTDKLELKRPYAKLRVVALDLDELNLNCSPAAVRVTYHQVYEKRFNAVLHSISGADTTQRETFVDFFVDDVRHNMANHHYNLDYDAQTNTYGENSSITLFTDYILATDHHTDVQFTMEIFDNKDMKPEHLVRSIDFETQIPVQRNHLTTVKGNMLTTKANIEVTIEDNFDKENYREFEDE